MQSIITGNLHNNLSLDFNKFKAIVGIIECKIDTKNVEKRDELFCYCLFYYNNISSKIYLVDPIENKSINHKDLIQNWR